MSQAATAQVATRRALRALQASTRAPQARWDALTAHLGTNVLFEQSSQESATRGAFRMKRVRAAASCARRERTSHRMPNRVAYRAPLADGATRAQAHRCCVNRALIAVLRTAHAKATAQLARLARRAFQGRRRQKLALLGRSPQQVGAPRAQSVQLGLTSPSRERHPAGTARRATTAWRARHTRSHARQEGTQTRRSSISLASSAARTAA